MSEGKFDFGALVDDQLKGIRRGYKFGKAFNDDKLIVRPKKPVVQVGVEDNASIKQAWEEGAAIAGLVEKELKGGYEVTVAGQRAFCPFSQIDKFKKESAEYLGRKFDFLVTEYALDERGLNVVVSRRALIEVQEQAMKEAMLEQLNEGETLHGTVTRVMDFGAFVDLGGVEGAHSRARGRVGAGRRPQRRPQERRRRDRQGDAHRPRGGQDLAFAQGVHGARVSEVPRRRGGGEVRRGSRGVDGREQDEERRVRHGRL